ncbi:MAG: ribose-phosphate diphosphokinase [Candidatus Chromulinivorax sp.]|nr:ribose-phosphate diphosphokinase [Candidatus Chromulinivorax sp.]
MLFIQDQYQYLVEKSMHREDYLVSQFDNQEFALKITPQVYEQKCMVLGSLTAPADQALQLLLLLHTLSKAGVKQLILFSPYLGYQRQDAVDTGRSHGLQWADAMLHAAGVQQIITIESHCQQSLLSLKIPVVSYSAEYIFEQEIAHFVSLGFSFIFPDAGAAARHHWISEKFPASLQGSFVKNRLHGTVNIQGFQGKMSRKVIIYDDILDSGQTLLQVCIALREMGVEEIIIFVTHAFFHGHAWNDLWSLGVKKLYCTNSLPCADQIKHLGIHVKSIAEFLQKSI